MNKLRVSMTERGGSIKGVFEWPADNIAGLEMFGALLHVFAQRYGRTIEEAAREIYAVAAEKVRVKE